HLFDQTSQSIDPLFIRQVKASFPECVARTAQKNVREVPQAKNPSICFICGRKQYVSIKKQSIHLSGPRMRNGVRIQTHLSDRLPGAAVVGFVHRVGQEELSL